MPSSENKTLVTRLKRLSNILCVEQRRLLEVAAESDGLPNNGVLRQIAELELNIVAVENSLAELETK
ncbi:hypothetical protein OIV19_23145 [Brucella sp. HL-2]|nr:hypothetical protein [Brucella sp. HL-2]MCV9910464.1 hypothetical protein [Brucella sp. HL-2]